MNFYPTKVTRSFLVSVLLFLILILSCSKDSDLLKDAILDPDTPPISQASTDEEEETEEEATEEEPVEEDTEEPLVDEEANKVPMEVRTTVFSPIQDAYLQDGEGHNDEIVRLEENRRESYLMFDLSPIDSIGGIIEESHLEFTIATDDGDGTISVLKGDATPWDENNLSANTAPKVDSLLGETTNDYRVGQTKSIDLEKGKLENAPLTLVLKHENGDDLAFASKENTSHQGPKLVVVYEAPQDAEAISGDDMEEWEAPSTEESATNEEVPNTDGEESERPDEAPETLVENEPDAENPVNAGDTINQSPTAVIVATPKEGEAPLKVNLKGDGSTDDVQIVSYSWDLGNGDSSKDKNTSYTFEKAGDYKVSLTVKDEEGESHQSSLTIKVTEKEEENQAPKAKISANKVEGAIPLEIKFNGGNSTDDHKISGYFWDFKDGNKATSASPSHTFTKEGTYEVSLTVTDEEGLKNTSTLSIKATEAKNEAPVAVISGGPFEGYAPLKVEFKAWNSKDDNEVTAYSWDFKDGSTTTTKNPDHTYKAAGSYDVALTVKDAEGLTHTVKQIVKVSPAPTDNDGGSSSDGGSSGSGSNDNGGSDSSGGSSGGSSNSGAHLGPLKAFPTAEGFGKNATGGRGGIVVEVTNLNDSGPGSLRYALEEIREPRTIVFKVGGTINAKSNLPIYAGRGNVTIAGQTAPGGGILIKNGSLSIQADNVIVRHLRFRMNSSTNPQNGHNMDGIRVRSSNQSIKIKNIIIDHCSVSWALDENLSTRYAENVTIQNSILGESTRAMLIAGAKNISVLNNLFVLNSSRNVLANTVKHEELTFEQVNNIVYGFNWATSGTEGMKFNVIGNYYKQSNDFAGTTKFAITLTPPDPANGDTGNIKTTHAYLKDNLIDPKISAIYRGEIEPYLFTYPKSKSSYNATNANDLDGKLLGHVGASKPKRDAVDSRLINHYKNSSGNISTSGFFPTINNGTAYKDSDKDGMADDWEKSNGLNPNDPSDGKKDRNGDGYTNLEEYLYYLSK
ncbi:PKD domain-containing protein [Cytophaga sp. FL35]|uniref:PKD domain-containing protein n=1 Tax=Cytophaga sp. FL35 TaxID=1904456 RepID=UPI0016538CA5|nr:PKD domain-containing protein [Cytophaga sp. FL35]MBC6997991.1 PKD domain-containing protein [Cytophaga sp. FL35]